MGSNLVVVAVPDENDRVWKVSSEKVPHLTLLFLGEAEKVDNAQQIVEFVEHAATTMLNRFYLSVDRRDTLGADEADVLFFRKSGYDIKAVREFRNALLKDSNIRTAYDSVEQFEGWTPHLTLGYPAEPAKVIPDNELDRFYDVNFNKIAVWMGDFEGPEFLLEDYWDKIDQGSGEFDMDIAMSGLDEEKVQAGMALLEHHGIKGMKWGQRSKAQNLTEGQKKFHDRREAKAGAKADKKWQKGLGSTANAVKVHNAASDEIEKKLPAFNADKRWKDKDGNELNLYHHPDVMDKYNRAYESEVANPAYANAAVKVHGATSPGGRYKLDIKDASTGLLKVTDTHKMEHAEGDGDLELQVKITRDANGLVSSIEIVPDKMAQTAMHGAVFVDGLMHHGVKGMKWGVRKDPPKPVSPSATSKVPHGDKRKTKIVTEGGENHPAHADAIKVAQAKAKLVKSGPSALSNQELRDVAQRVQLEQQATSLVSRTTRVGKGRAFVKSLTGYGKEFNDAANTAAQTRRLATQIR